jgi:p-aminobenzoyl-glutamate transporter AbgT
MTTKRSCNILTRTMILLLLVIFLIKHSNGIITSIEDPGRPGKRQEQYDSIQSKDPRGSGIFFAGGIITSFANIVGCCTIIVITFNRWKRRKPKTLTPSQRYPIYSSVIDLFIALITMPNLFYPMQNDKLLNTKGLCVGIGFSMSMLISMNMMIMAVISIVTYLRICKGRVASLGKYDWILGMTVLVPSLLISIITLASNGYGEDNYWYVFP